MKANTGNPNELNDSTSVGPGISPWHLIPIHYPQIKWRYYPLDEGNKTEKAHQILKRLIKKGVIKEPSSFKKFCELIEEISQIL